MGGLVGGKWQVGEWDREKVHTVDEQQGRGWMNGFLGGWMWINGFMGGWVRP